MTQTTESKLAAEAIELAAKWVEAAAGHAADAAAERLADVLRDPSGLKFTIGFVDGVMRPEDPAAAAAKLQQLAPLTPRFLPWYQHWGVRLGAVVAPVLPWVVIPIARVALRQMVNHLIADARPHRLGATVARLRERGHLLNLNLLGEAILGDDEALRRLDGIHELIRRPDVDYVSVKVSAIAGRISPWGFDDIVDLVAQRLAPLYLTAATNGTFINLDMEEYRDLDLTTAVYTRILSDPRLRDLETGIVLQAYLPDALPALEKLTSWARQRVAEGGARIKVRLVKGANLAMEQVEAAMHDWPLATYNTKVDSDANYLRCLDFSLRPENSSAVRIGMAGHNLFDLAYAWLLAGERGVRDDLEIEMLLGMAQGQVAAVSREVGSVRLYVPVVHPREFDVAISYLVRRLEENASNENFLSAAFHLNEEPRLFDRERDRFLASLERSEDPALETGPRRTQDRSQAPAAVDDAAGFHNEPDSDPSLAANREWADSIASRISTSQAGNSTIAAARVTSEAELESIVKEVTNSDWGSRSGSERAAVLRRVAHELRARRTELIEVACSETGKIIGEADIEVSEAVDFAAYYAGLAEELDQIDGANFLPSKLTVVAPPWNFPLAIPAGGALAALAAGSGVIFKPAPQARRCAAVVADALWAGGVPRDAMRLVDIDEGALGQQLIAHEAVDRVILTGSWETAALFRSWRSELPILAETSGKNAMIVMPSADLDLAAADLVKSAFSHAGQKCSAASLAILVGSVGSSRRFRRQVLDAAASLRVGLPEDGLTEVGPMVEPPQGKLEWALTTLDEGEKWVLRPHCHRAPGIYAGRLWSPGIRDGVRPNSRMHREEFFGPVLGIMRADSLEEAIELQNAVDYGLTAGLYTQEASDLEYWLDRVQAGNLYVNRGITGAIVQRQPFGGWKRSQVGAGAKAGGPNYLIGLGSWEPAEPLAAPALELQSEISAVVRASADSDWLGAAAASDQLHWDREFGTTRDVSGLVVERNLFRYRPTSVAIRAVGEPRDAIRVALAAIRAAAPAQLSTTTALPSEVTSALSTAGVEVLVESEESWLQRMASARPTRVRLAGDPAAAKELHARLSEAVAGDPDVAVYDAPVTQSGRLELLPFLREQAISITAHRFGNLDDWSKAVI